MENTERLIRTWIATENEEDIKQVVSGTSPEPNWCLELVQMLLQRFLPIERASSMSSKALASI